MSVNLFDSSASSWSSSRWNSQSVLCDQSWSVLFRLIRSWVCLRPGLYVCLTHSSDVTFQPLLSHLCFSDSEFCLCSTAASQVIGAQRARMVFIVQLFNICEGHVQKSLPFKYLLNVEVRRRRCFLLKGPSETTLQPPWDRLSLSTRFIHISMLKHAEEGDLQAADLQHIFTGGFTCITQIHQRCSFWFTEINIWAAACSPGSRLARSAEHHMHWCQEIKLNISFEMRVLTGRDQTV